MHELAEACDMDDQSKDIDLLDMPLYCDSTSSLQQVHLVILSTLKEAIVFPLYVLGSIVIQRSLAIIKIFCFHNLQSPPAWLIHIIFNQYSFTLFST